MSDLSNRARSLANLQEQLDAISPRETHKPMIDCLRACANTLDTHTHPPEVLALVEAANAVDDEYIGTLHGPYMSSIDDLRAALAPFSAMGVM